MEILREVRKKLNFQKERSMDFVKARLNENQKVLIKKLKGNMKTIL